MQGTAIAIAWPETKCKQAGAWYDGLLSLFGLNKDNYYKVGHAALVLHKNGSDEVEYFDFGRYHAPFGQGRVRSKWSDHDLKVVSIACTGLDGNIENPKEIMDELAQNNACHGEGALWYSMGPIDYDNAKKKALSLQAKGSIPYGPFLPTGTNCSRFVCSVLQAGAVSGLKRTRLRFPYTFSPTPKSNVKIWGKYRIHESK